MPLPKVLFVTSELFPEFGYPTAGGGVRAQQLFRSLESAGYRVELALLRSSAADKDLPDWATKTLYRPEFLDGLIEQADPDAVVSEGWEPLSHLKFQDNRIYVADCPGPLVLENHHRNVGDLRSNTYHKVRTLSRLDAVLCPNKPMRFYVGGFLTLAGWTPEQADRILNVPIALPETLPERTIRADEPLTVFLGGISWAWNRVSDWLPKLADLLERESLGKLRVRLGKHPHHTLDGEIYESIDSRLRNHPALSLDDLTGWETLVKELCTTSVAVDWGDRHLEREIASTLRIITYLWCGVPVILRSHLDIAGEIRRYRAGWVIDDWEDLSDILRKISKNRQEVEERSRNAQRLIRDRHTWPHAHEPLLGFLETPKQREKPPSFLAHAAEVFQIQETELHRLREERRVLDEEMTRLRREVASCIEDAEAYRSLRQKFLYRLWKRLMG